MMDDLLQEMIDPAPQRADVSRWRRLGATAAIFALAGLGITSLTTNALFTDRETTAGDLLTGTVDVGLNGTDTFSLPAEGLAPGDSVAKPITVVNNGSLALRYAVSYQTSDPTTALPPGPTLGPDAAPTGTEDIRDWTSLEVFVVDATHPCVAVNDTTRDDAPPADPLSKDATAFTPILGSYQTTPFTDGRTLGVSDATRSEQLCARATLDLDAGNALQASGTKITLRFDAEQVVNNTPAPTTP
ncbi:MAG TPA: TasA family protein [Cellulomonas sp.]